MKKMYTVVFEMIAGQDDEAGVTAEEWATAKQAVKNMTIQGKAPIEWLVDAFGDEANDNNWSFTVKDLAAKLNEAGLTGDDKKFMFSLQRFAAATQRDKIGENADSWVTLTTARDAWKELKEWAGDNQGDTELFNAVDADGDGVVTLDEFEAFLNEQS